jgi:beta-glucosidase/6-phospho-beta-glucosidase/beta-galactosidase
VITVAHGKSKAVSLEQREADLAQAELRLEKAGEAWLDARVQGNITPAIKQEADEAEADVRRAARKLEKTRKRVKKA